MIWPPVFHKTKLKWNSWNRIVDTIILLFSKLIVVSRRREKTVATPTGTSNRNSDIIIFDNLSSRWYFLYRKKRSGISKCVVARLGGICYGYLIKVVLSYLCCGDCVIALHIQVIEWVGIKNRAMVNILANSAFAPKIGKK